jgi:hypothetical protein
MIRYNRNIDFDNLAVVIDEIKLSFDKLRFSGFECNVGFLTQIEHGNLDDVKASLRVEVEGTLADAREHLASKGEGCCKKNLTKLIATAENQVLSVKIYNNTCSGRQRVGWTAKSAASDQRGPLTQRQESS